MQRATTSTHPLAPSLDQLIERGALAVADDDALTLLGEIADEVAARTLTREQADAIVDMLGLSIDPHSWEQWGGLHGTDARR